jgi:hypothetical protein
MEFKTPKRYFKYDQLDQIVLQYPLKSDLDRTALEVELNKRKCFLHFVLGVLRLDPLQRWTPKQALSHPFITQSPFSPLFEPAPDPDCGISPQLIELTCAETKRTLVASAPSTSYMSYAANLRQQNVNVGGSTLSKSIATPLNHMVKEEKPDPSRTRVGPPQQTLHPVVNSSYYSAPNFPFPMTSSAVSLGYPPSTLSVTSNSMSTTSPSYHQAPPPIQSGYSFPKTEERTYTRGRPEATVDMTHTTIPTQQKRGRTNSQKINHQNQKPSTGPRQKGNGPMDYGTHVSRNVSNTNHTNVNIKSTSSMGAEKGFGRFPAQFDPIQPTTASRPTSYLPQQKQLPTNSNGIQISFPSHHHLKPDHSGTSTHMNPYSVGPQMTHGSIDSSLSSFPAFSANSFQYGGGGGGGGQSVSHTAAPQISSHMGNRSVNSSYQLSPFDEGDGHSSGGVRKGPSPDWDPIFSFELVSLSDESHSASP